MCGDNDTACGCSWQRADTAAPVRVHFTVGDNDPQWHPDGQHDPVKHSNNVSDAV